MKRAALTRSGRPDPHGPRVVDERRDFVRILSVPSCGVHGADVARAGERAVARPIAPWAGNVRMMPTVLFRGHLAAQPAEPLDLWETRPFGPVARKGPADGRGASDHKGGRSIPILAAGRLPETTGRPPVNVKFFIGVQSRSAPHPRSPLAPPVGRDPVGPTSEKRPSQSDTLQGFREASGLAWLHRSAAWWGGALSAFSRYPKAPRNRRNFSR